MGIFSSKSSSSTSNPITNNIGLSEVSGDALVVNGSGNTLTDQGAVNKSFEFARYAAGESFAIANEVAKSSGELTKSTAATSAAIAANVAAKSVSDTGDKFAELGRWIVGGAVIVAGVWLYNKKRGAA